MDAVSQNSDLALPLPKTVRLPPSPVNFELRATVGLGRSSHSNAWLGMALASELTIHLPTGDSQQRFSLPLLDR